ASPPYGGRGRGSETGAIRRYAILGRCGVSRLRSLLPGNAEDFEDLGHRCRRRERDRAAAVGGLAATAALDPVVGVAAARQEGERERRRECQSCGDPLRV